MKTWKFENYYIKEDIGDTLNFYNNNDDLLGNMVAYNNEMELLDNGSDPIKDGWEDGIGNSLSFEGWGDQCEISTTINKSKINELKEQLYNKISNEYENYIEDIKKMPIGKILENAYEIATKENMVMLFENCDLSYEETKSLLQYEEPLNQIYCDWLHLDSSEHELFNESISYTIEKAKSDDIKFKSVNEIIKNKIDNNKTKLKAKER